MRSLVRWLLVSLLFIPLANATLILWDTRPSLAAQGPVGFTFQGRLLNAAGTAPLTDVVDLTLGIYSPDGLCLLYEEVHSAIDLSLTNGTFAVNVGSAIGDPKRTASDPVPPLSMAQIFSNAGTQLRAVASPNCAGGYTPAAGDTRALRVTVTPQAGLPMTLSPDQVIDAAPFATSAETLQGFTPSQLIQVLNNVSQATMTTLTDGSDASALHNHDSLYVLSGSATAQTFGSGGASTLGNIGVGVATPVAGVKLEVDSTAANSKGIVIQGFVGQTANLFEVKNNLGTVLTSIAPSGGITAPSLSVSTLAVTGGTPGAGKVLTSDATGNATWQNAGTSSQWTTTGSDIYYNTGNVGIGTNSPEGTLHLKNTNNGATAKQLILQGNPGQPNAYAGIEFKTTLHTTGNGAMIQAEDTDTWKQSLIFKTTDGTAATDLAAERMRIDYAGNVGIGNSTPKAKLDVDGDIRIGNANATCDANTVGSQRYNSGTNKMEFCNGTTWGNIDTNTGGTVTTVSGNAPISVTNGSSTPAISISQANTSTAGYLSSADWNTFNGKESVLTFSAPLSRSTNTISIPAATSVSNGYLSNTDWLIFNGKLGTSLSSGQIFVGDNSNVATGVAVSGDATLSNAGVLTLANTVSAGTYTKVTVDTKGRVTGSSSLAAADIPNPAGDVTGTYAATTVSKIQGRTVASTLPNSGEVLKWDGSQWAPAADSTGGGSQWTTTGSDIYYNTGNVGIGTTSPTTGTRLDITGTGAAASSIIIPRDTVANRPTTGVNGMMRYASDTNKFEVYENGAWVNMVSSGAATSVGAINGTAAAPSISFSGDTNTGFYSNGADTIGITTNGVNVFNISSTTLSSPTTGGALITTGNGTAAAPTFSFAGDLDTGWWRPAADTMAASTGGTERMRIDSSGNVGIGTTTPGSALDVVGNTTTSAWLIGGALQVNNAGTANTPGINLVGNSSSSTGIFTPAANVIAFSNNNAETVRITATGSVGIGTSGPSALLEVSKSQAAATSIYVTNTSTSASAEAQVVATSNAGYFGFGINSTNKSGGVAYLWNGANTDLLVGTNNAERMRITSTGSVGIGTNAPSTKLEVAGNALFGSDVTKQISLSIIGGGGAIGTSATWPMYLYPGNTPTTGLYNNGGMSIGRTFFNTGAPTDGMIIEGNVGIGTTSPSYKLDVNGNSRILGYLYGLDNIAFDGGGNNISFLQLPSDTLGRLSVANASGTTEHLTVLANGNVGIGTSSPSHRLHVTNNATAFSPQIAVNNQDTSANAFAQIAYLGNGRTFSTGVGNSSATGYDVANKWFLYDLTADAMRLVVNTSGNVGIGITSPGAKLDVNGNLRVATLNAATATHVCIDGSNILSSCSSSIRYKEDVLDLNMGLKELLQLRPVTYKWKDRNEIDLGFIAEEVERVNPLLATHNKDGSIQGVKYDQLTALITNAIKELYARMLDLFASDEKQNRDIAALKADIDQLRADNVQLKQDNAAKTKELEAIKAYLCAKDPSATICK